MSRKSDHSAIPSKTVPTYAHKRRHLILSVDDEPSLLQTREQLLQFSGYEVLSAANGEKALEIFATHPVDLVLLDFRMPGMDGGIVAQQMKRRKPQIPVVMVSANEVPDEALSCVDGFIAKGQHPNVLLEQIRPLLASLGVCEAGT
jgi:two-component system alkaline phosphatase synthesis response regulator PhoP